MNTDLNNNSNNRSTPGKTYEEELNNKGTTFTDTNAESNERDKAKIDKALSGYGQKMDSVHPDQLEDDREAEEIDRERKEKE